MYAIALTSIPPRLPRLGPVLAGLLAQEPAPARVVLCLPERWARFPKGARLPALPEGIDVLRTAEDLGPATKALGPARALAGQVDRLIYCDDDWLMPPGWAARLLAAQEDGEAVAASGWSVNRLGRRGAARPGCVDIAQGFSGVLIAPRWLAQAPPPPAGAGWAADDIWLSGELARQGVPIRLAVKARAGLVPAYEDAHALQDAVIGGQARHAANMACVDRLTQDYGIWPAQ